MSERACHPDCIIGPSGDHPGYLGYACIDEKVRTLPWPDETPTPYYQDENVTLYHGDCREILPALRDFDLVLTDPPYGETSIPWDRWPEGWPTLLAAHAYSMWVFGSMRMFLDRRDEFAGWTMSQDIVWEKHAGTGVFTDRFKRMHEHAVHWYRGDWSTVYHDAQRIKVGNMRRSASKPKGSVRAEHLGGIHKRDAAWEDDGTRLVGSVFKVHTMHRRGDHPTEKPTGILEPLIEYACPPGGSILDPFAGSGSTLAAAKATGRKAVGVEADERYCEAAARRLAQDTLFGGAA